MAQQATIQRFGLREGDPGDAFFLLARGRVRVTRRGDALATLTERRAILDTLEAHVTGWLGVEGVRVLDPSDAAVRASSNGAQQWCEAHSHPHLRLHVYDAVDVFPLGYERPGSI